jgi:integrase
MLESYYPMAMTEARDESPTIETFLSERLYTNKNTVRTYRSQLKSYFEFLRISPESYLGRDYKADVSKYYMYLVKEKYTSTAIKGNLNAIRQFICWLDRPAKDLEIWETISRRMRGVQPASEERALTREDMKKILSYADVKSRAMFLVSISSGIREETLVGLLPSDIHLDENPTRIVLRPEIVKGKKKWVTTFISDEAKEALMAWLKVRDAYLQSAVGKCSRNKMVRPKNADDKRIFPMHESVVRDIWLSLVEKAGMAERDPNTNRLKAREHCLRKFFRSHLGNRDLSEFCEGHSDINNLYDKKSDAERGSDYLKCMMNVTIFAVGTGVPTEEFELMKKKIDQQADLIKRLNEGLRNLAMTHSDPAIRKLFEERERGDNLPC